MLIQSLFVKEHKTVKRYILQISSHLSVLFKDRGGKFVVAAAWIFLFFVIAVPETRNLWEMLPWWDHSTAVSRQRAMVSLRGSTMVSLHVAMMMLLFIWSCPCCMTITPVPVSETTVHCNSASSSAATKATLSFAMVPETRKHTYSGIWGAATNWHGWSEDFDDIGSSAWRGRIIYHHLRYRYRFDCSISGAATPILKSARESQVIHIRRRLTVLCLWTFEGWKIIHKKLQQDILQGRKVYRLLLRSTPVKSCWTVPLICLNFPARWRK